MIIYGCVMFASYFALIGKREKQKICPNAIYFLPCRFLYKKRQFSRNGFHGKFCFFRFRDKIKKKHYLIEVRQNPVNLSKGRKKKFFFSATGKEKRRKAYFLYVPSISLQCAISPPRPTLIVNFFLFFVVENWVRPVMFFKFSPANALSPPPLPLTQKKYEMGKTISYVILRQKSVLKLSSSLGTWFCLIDKSLFFQIFFSISFFLIFSILIFTFFFSM